MGYHGERLASLADPLESGVKRFARRTTAKAGDELLKRVRRHTPIAKPGTASIRASFASSGDWISSRGGRTPGTLWRSWKVGEVEVVFEATGEHRRVEVYTFDPVAPNVEWDTQPHRIPAKPGGVLAIPTPDGMVFARSVEHPGTKGVHMMATAQAEVAAYWRVIAEREWRQEALRLWTAGQAA